MKGLFHSRKAQLTVFIIIGIILVFSVGIYAYLRSAGIGPSEIFQPKSPPVVAFIDACIERTGTEAIKAMGDKGGFIVLPPGLARNPTRHVSLVPGVGGDFAPKVPYWYYDGQTKIPSVEYMEHETELFIEERLGDCLNDYEGLTEEYVITELSNYSADVTFADKDSIVRLDYEIEFSPRGSNEVTKRDEFIVDLDVKVRRMWELAKEILEDENEMTFFENMTINLMTSHPPEDIPFTGWEFDCSPRQWFLSEVKKKLMYALTPAVLATRFKNTNHPPWEADEDAYRVVDNAVREFKESEVVRPLRLPEYIPSDSYDYFQYHFTTIDEDYRDLNVVASYKEAWGMNLLATPNEYGVMKATTKNLRNQILQSLLCLNTYHFVYDLTYPVMISISDPNAFHKTGFVFRYAFPVQIYHNTADRGLRPTQIIEPEEYDLDYCDFVSPIEHTIIVRDSVTNAEMSKVNLTFRCISQQCHLGTTRTNNRHLQWSGSFPEGCAGAVILAEKDGYLDTEEQYYSGDPFYIDMIPTQEVKFDVKRHTTTEPGVARFLDPDMYAIIQLDSTDPPFSVFDVFGSEDIFNRTERFEIPRDDVLYNLNIILMKKLNADEDMLVGGWVGNWSVDHRQMLDAEKVVFHVPQKVPTPRDEMDLIEVYQLINNRSMFPDIGPEIVRADEYSGDEDTDSVEGGVAS